MTRLFALSALVLASAAAPARDNIIGSFGPGYSSRFPALGAAWWPNLPAYPAAPASYYGAYITAYRGPASFAYGTPFVPSYGYPYIGYSYPYLNYGAPFSVSYGFAYAAGTELPYVTAFEGCTIIPGSLTPLGPPGNYLYSQNSCLWNASAPPAASDSGEPPMADGTARITLRVPADAEVIFQGQPSKQAGPVRVFATPPLSGPGTYEVKVRWTDNGKQIEQATSVTVKPGDQTSVTVLP